MSKELIVSTGKHETRVAILEDDQLVEIFHEREKEYSLAGSIHKGRVTRVLPGMQSAFVDIGLERDAFLYVSDFFEDNDEYDAVVSTVEDKILKMEKGGGQPPADRSERAENPGRSEAPVFEGAAFVSAPPVSAERREEPVRTERSGPGPDRGGDRGAGGGGGDRGAGAGAAGDRGRGRRGRRRRGGGGAGGGRGPGGLPDSKFFSPGSEQDAQEDAEPQDAPIFEASVPEVTIHSLAHVAPPRAPVTEDFAVLPGESLAKYVLPGESLAKYAVADIHEDMQAASEEEISPEVAAEVEELVAEAVEEAKAELAAEPVAESEPVAEAVLVVQAVLVVEAVADEAPVAEPALPVDHPFAGLGVVSSVTSEPVAEAVVFEPVAVEPAADGEPEIKAEHSFGDRVALPEAEGLEPLELGEGMEGAEEDEPVAIDQEGPEPARIPTSLTAALREQGHRYPHRVSRRMRRKMRGGPGSEERSEKPEGENAGEQTPSDAAVSSPGITLPGESRTVTSRPEAQSETRPEVRAEGRPEQREGGRRPDQRGDRGGNRDRSRGDRGADRGGDRGVDRSADRSADRSGERTERPERAATERPERGGDRTERPERTERPDRERPVLPSISDLLKEGQEIIVQIAKEPLGQKGARITSHIALPGRFVVYMPTVDHAGVSRKIPSDEERHRLKRVVQTHRQGIPGGFICRTAAEGKTEEELKSDMHFLYNLWLDMRQKAEKRPAPVLLHHDLDLVQRILRDQLTESFKTIWVDNEELYESILRFAQRFQPALVGRVKLYTRANPIFDEFGITNELEKALRPKVWLKSGGYIVINQTEALVAIDINTGKYVGKSNRLEDTIVKINTDAIKEIVRQIRLRDLGGIIVVDFIDMDERKNRQKVMQVLEESMRADRAPYKILQFNDFGLVAITRKRVKQSLERTLCSPCPYCEGAGYIKSVQTVISEILQEAQRMKKALEDEHNNIMLRVNPEVAKVLKSNHNQFLQELEEILGKSVLVKSDPLLHQTKFDLA
jgi:Rne/Rng family ribonuclease